MSRRSAIGGPFRVLFDAGTFRDLTDGQLLERFATARGEVGELAFAALVERHGSMVLRVCRGVLANADDSRDAFQATFLVLVEKARGLWVRDSIGPWLHQVAYRTAKCARSTAARRRRIESAMPIEAASEREAHADDLGPILHEEIERLPERYRAAIVLCDLQGRTHEQAARHLGWPVGTVKSRQSRGRDRLRERLRRRGVAPSVAILALRPGPALVVPPALAETASRAAIQSLTPGASMAGTAAASLALEVVKAMAMIRWWKLAAAVMMAGATATGVPLLARQDRPGDGEANPKLAVAKPARDDDARTTTVRPGKLRETIAERGHIEVGRTSEGIAKIAGRTTLVRIVPEGTLVKQNDLVAELDSAELQDQLVNQEIARQRAKADLDDAERSRIVAEIAVREYVDGIARQEVRILTRAVRTAESAIQRATTRIQRIEAAQGRLKEIMAARKEIAPADVMAEIDLADRLAEAGQERENKSDVQADAMGRLEQFQTYTKNRVINGLEAAVKQAESNERARKATFELEKAKEAKLREMVKNYKLYAPIDGIVAYHEYNQPGSGMLMLEEGSSVREGQKLFTLYDLGGPMLVNVKVREAIVDRLAKGNKVKVAVDALPDEVLTGVVKSISPRPDAPNGIPSDVKFYTTLVEIADPPKTLRPGMTAKADILIAEADDSLAVPISAVVWRDGKWQVAVKADGGHEWRSVKTGLYDGTRDRGSHEGLSIEIKSGLKPGESVFNDALSRMTDEEKQAHLGKFPPRPATEKGPGRPPRPATGDGTPKSQ